MLLAIDIGNTDIVCAKFNNKSLINEIRFPTNNNTYNEFNNYIDNRINDIIISSVVPSLTKNYIDICFDTLSIAPFIIKYNNIPQLQLDVDYPHQVGTDRICNAIAAQYLYEGPSIIIDLGTAIKYDVVDMNGKLIGGAIAPGIKNSSQFLFNSTELLKNIDLKFPEKAIGKDTNACLQSGIMYNTVDAIDGMIDRILNEMQWNEYNIILTGGLCSIIENNINHKHILDIHHTLKGIQLIHTLINID